MSSCRRCSCLNTAILVLLVVSLLTLSVCTEYGDASQGHLKAIKVSSDNQDVDSEDSLTSDDKLIRRRRSIEDNELNDDAAQLASSVSGSEAARPPKWLDVDRKTWLRRRRSSTFPLRMNWLGMPAAGVGGGAQSWLRHLSPAFKQSPMPFQTFKRDELRSRRLNEQEEGGEDGDWDTNG